MVHLINSGYEKKCKDSQGGIKELYLFPFVKYSFGQIIINGLNLITFPNTIIYRFEPQNEPNPQQSMQIDAGGKYYNQSINLEFAFLQNNKDLIKFLKKEYRIIFKDRNGHYRILGLYNGLEASTLNGESGNSKNSFNGYRIEFSGKEIKEAHYIDGLNNVGFQIFGDSNFRITQIEDIRVTQDNNERITQNG